MPRPMRRSDGSTSRSRASCRRTLNGRRCAAPVSWRRASDCNARASAGSASCNRRMSSGVAAGIDLVPHPGLAASAVVALVGAVASIAVQRKLLSAPLG